MTNTRNTRLSAGRKCELARAVAGKFLRHIRTIDELNGEKLRGDDVGRPHGFKLAFRKDLVWQVIELRGSLSKNGVGKRDRWIEALADDEKGLTPEQVEAIAEQAHRQLMGLHGVIDADGNVI